MQEPTVDALKERVAEWGNDAKRLDSSIASQLIRCTDLREKATEKAIGRQNYGKMEHNPIQYMRKAKADIRRLCGFRYKFKRERNATTKVNNQPETLQLDEWDTFKLKIEKKLSKFPSTLENVPVEMLVELLSIKDELRFQICDDFLEFLRQLNTQDESLMVILDYLAYLNVIEKFEYMQHDVQEMLMLKESGTDKELISLLTKKNKTLEDSNEKLQQQLAQANEKYENLKQNMDPHATQFCRDRVRLEDAFLSIQKAEKELNELRGINIKLLSENATLSDNLSHQYETTKKQLLEDQTDFGPQIDHLERMVATTATQFTDLKLNAGLVNDLYSKTTANLQKVEAQRVNVVGERDLMAQKLAEQIKAVATLRLEIERRDKIIMYALASRSTYSKEAEVTAQNLDATRSKLKKQVEDYTELKRVLLETEKTLDLTEKELIHTRDKLATIERELKVANDAVVRLTKVEHDAEIFSRTKRKCLELENELKHLEVQHEITTKDYAIAIEKLRKAEERITRFLG